MEKTRLSLDDLSVQSFATTSAPGEIRGTVRGHDAPTDQVECPTANAAWDTCWESCACGGGSGNSCDNNCDSTDCGGYSDWACTVTCHVSWTVSYCW
ncbi:MAG TPA: hypothetical protein VF541_09565 [Longimicrobium sp.]|jgi:hypothetical protein